MESYCTLELKRRPHTDLQVKVCLASYHSQFLKIHIVLRRCMSKLLKRKENVVLS